MSDWRSFPRAIKEEGAEIFHQKDWWHWRCENYIFFPSFFLVQFYFQRSAPSKSFWCTLPFALYTLCFLHCHGCCLFSNTHSGWFSFFSPCCFSLAITMYSIFFFFFLCNLFCHLICVYTAAEKINMISFPSKWKKKKKKPKDIQRKMVMNVWQPESHYKYKSVNVQLPSLSLLFFPRWQISKLSSRMGSVIICRVWLIAFPDDRALWKDFPFFFFVTAESSDDDLWKQGKTSCSFRLTHTSFRAHNGALEGFHGRFLRSRYWIREEKYKARITMFSLKIKIHNYT